MEWVYVVVIGGSIAASGYPTEEACQGHKVVFDREHKAAGACVKMPLSSSGLVIGSGSSIPLVCVGPYGTWVSC